MDSKIPTRSLHRIIIYKNFDLVFKWEHLTKKISNFKVYAKKFHNDPNFLDFGQKLHTAHNNNSEKWLNIPHVNFGFTMHAKISDSLIGIFKISILQERRRAAWFYFYFIYIWQFAKHVLVALLFVE